MITKSVLAKFVSSMSTTVSAGPFTFDKVEPIAETAQKLYEAYQAKDIKGINIVATMIRQQQTSVLTKAQTNMLNEMMLAYGKLADEGVLVTVGAVKLDAAGEAAAMMRKRNTAARAK
jgi:hypothetical protein